MKKGMILALGIALLAGCGSQANKGSGIPVEPKWKGLPYRLALDTKSGTPNPATLSIPAIKFTANPDSLETRAILVMRFTVPGGAGKEPVQHRMVGTPADVRGETGALPADYLDRTSKAMADYLAAYCVEGKVSASAALARSSLSPQAGDAEVDTKRLSDWLPFEIMVKKPHKKC